MRSHLTITFALIAMIPILILGGFQVSQITNITQETNQNQRQTTYRLGDAIEAYMSYHRNAVETLAATISASDAAFRNRESLTLKLQSLQENLAGFTGIYVVDDKGLIKATHQLSTNLVGTNVNDRDYTARVRAGQKPIISSLFKGPESANQPAIAISVPIYSNKQVDGFVLAVLELAPIKSLVTKYDYGSAAYPVVLDHAGRPIYHPNAALTESMADLSSEPVVADAKLNKQGEGTYELSSSTHKELITYKLIPDLNLIVWVSRSTAAVNAAFTESLWITLLLLVFTLIVTVLLGSLLAKRLNGTIHALVGYTQRLAGGSFAQPDQKVVPRGAPLELQQLAEHFFRMAAQIKENQNALLELNSELEHRVEERTQRLQDEHATLNAVLESMSDAIVLIDVQHNVLYANHRMAESFAIPMAALSHMPEADLFERIAELLSEEQDKLELSKLTAEPRVQSALTVKTEQGKPRFMMVSAFQVAREGRVFGRGYVWRDRTKEHEIDALKNDLISLASHEFKTPITSIRGGVETLLRSDAQWDEDFKLELLEGIHEDIGRIQDLIDEWLDISKIESGAMGIHPEPLKLASVVDSARRRLPDEAIAADIQFDVEFPAKTPLVNADKLRMEQVLLNLFINAVRYNNGKPVIKITADTDEQAVYLHVQDNGIGMAAEHLDKIFDRFYRVDVSSSRQTGGTGLGLAICKGIMEAHGGSITVESIPGQGSRFTLQIPRFQGEER